jgi:hypothetical protein
MVLGDTGTSVYGEIPGREDILLAPFVGGMRRLPSQSVGQAVLARPVRRILLMQRLDPSKWGDLTVVA